MNDANKAKSVNITVLTVSDTRTDENDKSGDTLVERIKKAGHRLVEKRIVKDEISLLQATLKGWIDSPEVDVVISTGGTG
ncbi:MAG: molybdopterin-binding protein, partial [Nitrospinaceae bacterium]|nr:molybdopterin-binding protein [Nitrospinaceae bacterium]